MPTITLTPAQANTIHLRLGDGPTADAMYYAAHATTNMVDVDVPTAMLPVLRAIALQMATLTSTTQDHYHQWRALLYNISAVQMQGIVDSMTP